MSLRIDQLAVLNLVTVGNSVTAGSFVRSGGTAVQFLMADGSVSTNPGWLTSITSNQVTTALGYTPYNATNPNGYTSNTGTVTSVSGTGTVSGLTLSGTVTSSGSLTLGGTLTLTSGQVTGALGYTPYNSSNPNGYITSSGSISGSAGSVAWTNVTGRPSALSSFTNDIVARTTLSASGDFQFGGQDLAQNNFSLSGATTDTDQFGRYYYSGTSGSIWSRYLPVDKTGRYRMRLRWKATASNSTYLAVILLDTNGNNINGAGTYWAYPWSGSGAPTSWTTSEYWYDGSSFPSNAAYVAFGISHTNYGGGSATYYVSQLELERYNDKIAGNTVWHAGNLTNLNQLSNGPGYITGYTETDTLATVTARGATTNASVRFGSYADVLPTGSAFRFFDGTTFRGGFGLDSWGHGGSDANLVLYVNGDNTLFFSTSGTKRASLSSSAFNSLVALQQNGNQVWHAGNLTNLNQLTNGPGYTTNVGTVTSVSGTGTVSGLTLSGTVTSSGSLTLGGTLSLTAANVNAVGAITNNTSGTAGSTAVLTASGSLTTQQGSGTVIYSYALTNPQTGLFAATDNANSILTVNRHPGNYYSQLGFSSNGNLYYRNFVNTAINTSQAWQTVWTSGSLTNLNQLTNGPGYITGSYLPTTGGGYGNGNYEFASSNNSDTGYSTAAIELRETDRGSSSSFLAPRLAFHWGNVTASQISIESSGRIVIRNNPGTGYEAFAAGTIKAFGNIYNDANYGHTIVGLYSDVRYQGVFAMGDSYKLPGDGTTTGSLYGLAWSHPNAGGVAANLNTHGLLVMENGSFLAAISGSIRARDDMRAPIFYDSGNSAYSLNGNTNSAWRVSTASGYLDIGPMNSSYCHFETDRGNFYFGSRIDINGELWRYNGSRFVENTGTWSINVTGYSQRVLSTSISNVNTGRTAGTLEYYDVSGATGQPESGWNSYISVRHGNAGNQFGFQFASPFGTDTLYWRGYDGSNPLGWRTVWHSGNLNVANWFGAVTTGGTTDWNHVTNTRPGTGYTLLLGSHSNGPGPGEYYHSFNLEYSSKDGTGNVTQMAIPYGSPANKLYMRGRYDGSWGGWTQFVTNSGTWGINVTGTAGSETLATVTSRGASSSTYISLSGGGIFNSNRYAFRNAIGSGVYMGSTTASRLEAFSDDGGAAYMTFHRSGSYAVHFGLDPDNVLRIGGYSAAASRLQLDMSGNLYTAGNMYPGGDIYFANASSPHTGTIRFGDNTGWVFRFQTSVSGTYTTRFSFADNGTFTAVGDVIAYSDARVKTNVATITDPLGKVTRMRGVTYNRTDSADASEKVGVIAQEIQQVLPQVVTKDEEGMLGVSYGNLAGVFIEAIKEQQKQIEELRKQIEYLTENK
jgi:hypothetical protein